MLNYIRFILTRTFSDNYGGFFDFLFGGDSNVEGFELPEFFEDEFVQPSQEKLFDLGSDLISGDIPDFFSPIANTGSSELESVIDAISGDISGSVAANAARAGRARGGGVEAATSEALHKIVPALRFQDFLRATQGKFDLLNLGTNITEGVRGAGLVNQGQRNQFNLGRSRLDLQSRTAQDELDLTSGGLIGQGIGSLFDIGNIANDILNPGGGGTTTQSKIGQGLGLIAPFLPAPFNIAAGAAGSGFNMFGGKTPLGAIEEDFGIEPLEDFEPLKLPDRGVIVN